MYVACTNILISVVINDRHTKNIFIIIGIFDIKSIFVSIDIKIIFKLLILLINTGYILVGVSVSDLFVVYCMYIYYIPYCQYDTVHVVFFV